MMRRGGSSEVASRASGVPIGGIGAAAGIAGRLTGRWRALRLAAFPARRGIGTSI
jgi:hypothetical protein